MKLEFNNSSAIESIGDVEGNIRGQRANDYMNTFSQSDNSLFNVEDIQPLDYADLNGKVLKMIVVENEGIKIIAGQDLDTKKIYMISFDRYK